MSVFEERKLALRNVVAVAATNIPGSSYTVEIQGRLRLWLAMNAAGIWSFDRDGDVIQLANGASVTGGQVFDVPVQAGDVIQVQHSVGGTAHYVYYDAVRDA